MLLRNQQFTRLVVIIGIMAALGIYGFLLLDFGPWQSFFFAILSAGNYRRATNEYGVFFPENPLTTSTVQDVAATLPFFLRACGRQVAVIGLVFVVGYLGTPIMEIVDAFLSLEDNEFLIDFTLFSIIAAGPIIGIYALAIRMRHRWRMSARLQAALDEIGHQ